MLTGLGLQSDSMPLLAQYRRGRDRSMRPASCDGDDVFGAKLVEFTHHQPRDFDQQIAFVTTRDRVRIAYARSGSGSVLLKTANWLTHLEYDWRTPIWRHWLEFLSGEAQLVRYDERGSGLSDHDVPDLSFDRWVDDLEDLFDQLGLRRCTLLGLSQGAAVAIEFAARHPERVERLVLHGAYARGWAKRDELERRRGEALKELIAVGWGADVPAYRQIFTGLFAPEATEAQSRWFDELQRISTEPEVAARLVEAAGQIDVVGSLPRVRAPTLVLHSRRDARVPFEEGRRLAAAIPGARFVPLDSSNHALLASDRDWPRFQQEVRTFLSSDVADETAVAAPPLPADLTPRELDVLQRVAEGLDNREIAVQLELREKTVRNHLTRILDKLGVRTRAQAIVRARTALKGR